ncbi:UpxY family transcription antiterminator [Flavobacteriaceae bacterium M23B6Z8]
MSFLENTIIKEKVKTKRRILTKAVSEKNWYVLYTAPRAEKIAKRELEFKGYEVFLPLTQTLRIWKNRQKKMIDTVLFPSYIFVFTDERHLAEICRVNKIKTFIQCGGKASKIKTEYIEGIKRMLDSKQEISVDHDFTEGEQVRIIKGPLTGYEGILVRQKTKTKFGIHLREINQTVLVEICVDAVEKITKTKSVKL